MCWGANAIFGRLAVGEASPMAVVVFRWLVVVILILVFARDHLKRDLEKGKQEMQQKN